MQKGRVIKGYSGFYYVKVNNEIIECKLRGKLKLSHSSVLVGDLVKVLIKGKKGVVEEILPRKNELVRPAIANVEQALVVFALKNPNPVLELLDRILLAVSHAGIEPVIVFTKTDIAETEDYFPVELYRKIGYKLVTVSSKEKTGTEEIKKVLAGKITVLAGPSGAGKSSLLNTVYPGLSLKTGEVSEKIGRGKHTTRHVELLPLEEEGYVADTPGFSVIYVPDIKPFELSDYYPDFSEYRNSCKFKFCSHKVEPECAVKEAVDKGLIDRGRFERYLDFLSQLEEKERKLYD